MGPNSGECNAPSDNSTPAQRKRGLRALVDHVGTWFPRNATREAVMTRIQLDGSPETVWKALRFYEEIPNRPGPFLAALLPLPVRSEGEKTKVGASIRCVYEGGHLVKRIIVAEPPHLLRFEVLEQNLGIENAVSMGEGSYVVLPRDGGSEVLLTTQYYGHLRPRSLVRPLERLLAHRVHRHILEGMRTLLGQAAQQSSADLARGVARLAPASSERQSPVA